MSDFEKLMRKNYPNREVHFGVEEINCWNSGIYNLNSVLGNGWAAGRIHLLVGKESTGKCVSKNTNVLTDKGYKTVEQIFKESEVDLSEEVKEIPKKVTLINRFGEKEDTTHFTCNGIRKVFKITTKSGVEINATENHPLLTISENGEHVWKNLEDITSEDYLISRKVGKKNVNLEEHAYFMGVLVADAHMSKKTIAVTNDDAEVIELLTRIGTELLCKPVVYNSNNSLDTRFTKVKAVNKFYKDNGLKPCLSAEKSVPDNIMLGTNSEKISFLCGYFDCESFCDGRSLEICSASRKLLHQTKLLLSEFGIISSLNPKKVKNYEHNDYYRLLISGVNYESFMLDYYLPNCISKKPQERYLEGKYRSENAAPFCKELIKVFYEKSEGKSRESSKLIGGYYKGCGISEGSIKKLLQVFEITDDNRSEYDRISKVIDYRYDPVLSVEFVGKMPTFDFTMESTESFVCEGVISHNSTIANKFAGVVNSTNWKTGKFCDPASDAACKVLYIDAEGTLDREYAEHHNYFPEIGGNLVLSATTGNQVVDIVNAAIQSKEFSLIVVDSLEALIPYKDLEKSSEDFVVGTRAKMLNDAFRRWTVSMIDASRSSEQWQQRPTLLCINQLREAISARPMPPQIPGGIGQKQAATTIVQMNTPKYSDDGKLASKVNLRGTVKKNKMFTPRGEVNFEMAVKDLPEQGLSIGQVDNIGSVLKDIRRFKLWEKKDDGLWYLFGYTANKQDEFATMMREDPEIHDDIMTKTVRALKK